MMLNPRLEMGEDFVYKKTDNNINEFKEYGLCVLRVILVNTMVR